MQDFLGVKQGEIRIGGSTIPGEYILPRVIGLFSKEYPRITVTLTVADSEEIESRVLDGEFELGVIGRKSSNKHLASHELWEDELVLALPSTHRWAAKKEVSHSGNGAGTLHFERTWLGDAEEHGTVPSGGRAEGD